MKLFLACLFWTALTVSCIWLSEFHFPIKVLTMGYVWITYLMIFLLSLVPEKIIMETESSRKTYITLTTRPIALTATYLLFESSIFSMMFYRGWYVTGGVCLLLYVRATIRRIHVSKACVEYQARLDESSKLSNLFSLPSFTK